MVCEECTMESQNTRAEKDVDILKQGDEGRTSVTQMHKQYTNHVLLTFSFPQCQINGTNDHLFAVLGAL